MGNSSSTPAAPAAPASNPNIPSECPMHNKAEANNNVTSSLTAKAAEVAKIDPKVMASAGVIPSECPMHAQQQQQQISECPSMAGKSLLTLQVTSNSCVILF